MRANRPTSISHPGGTDTFSWNALGQRMRATFWGPGCVRRYFYDGQRVLEETNDAGGIYARYIAEGSSYYDPLLLFARCSGEVRYPLYDGIGTTQRLVDQNGTVTDSYTLDAFGKPFSSTGSTRNPYRYGGAWDYFTDYLGSGLLQLGHRFYWPEVGRFIQQDPEGEGVNWYAYADDNPVTGIDPEGLRISVEGDRGCYDQAIDYLSRDPMMKNTIDDLTNSPILFRVFTNDAGVDQYNPLTREIDWDPHSALRCLPGGGTQTPALGLGHEFGHANGPLWKVRKLSLTPDAEYGSGEERRVILGIETPVARRLGEGTRANHGGGPFWVPTPISR